MSGRVIAIIVIIVIVLIATIGLIYAYSGDVTTASAGATSCPACPDVSTGASNVFPDGSIVRNPDDGKVYLIYGGKRHHFQSAVYTSCGRAPYMNMPAAIINAHPAGPDVPTCTSSSSTYSDPAIAALKAAGYV